MAVAADSRDPLVRLLTATRISDAEMRTMLRDSAKEAERLIARSGSVRAAQLGVAAQQREMWSNVENYARVNIGDGADAASESAAYLTEVMMGKNGLAAEGYRHAVLAQGRAGIEGIISRGTNGIPLSQTVYNTSVKTGATLDRTINAMILNGASAREIATRVSGFINPDTPGGVSYAAMRLGRSELNNAFHTTSVRLANVNPMVEAMQWNLSGSHPKADACDAYAHDVHMRRGDPGVFAKDEVPNKPHPQCFCYVTPVTLSDEEFVRAFNKGKYDSYIDQTMGCSRG